MVRCDAAAAKAHDKQCVCVQVQTADIYTSSRNLQLTQPSLQLGSVDRKCLISPIRTGSEGPQSYLMLRRIRRVWPLFTAANAASRVEMR